MKYCVIIKTMAKYENILWSSHYILINNNAKRSAFSMKENNEIKIKDLVNVFSFETLITILEDENCPGEIIHEIIEKCYKNVIILELAVRNKNIKREDLEKIAQIGSENVILALISNDKITAEILRGLLRDRIFSNKIKEDIINKLEKTVTSEEQ